MKLSEIKSNPNNPRKISNEQLQKLINSLKSFPEMMVLRPIIIDEKNVIQGGNMRFKALQKLGYKEIPDEWVKQGKDLTPEQWSEFVVKDNVSFGEWDFDILQTQYDANLLSEFGVDLNLKEETPDAIKAEAYTKLTERFVVPPLSILDTRQGYWQERKNLWKTAIGDNGESREGILRPSKSLTPNYYQKKAQTEAKIGHKLSNPEFEEKYFDECFSGYDATVTNGASIFDPVLAELINRWFGIEKGNVCDPFAGGAFGFVSDFLGNSYTGIELRQEQAGINNSRLRSNKSRYICDDGQNIAKHLEPESQDLLFCCPPYFNLEVYSDLPNDASNQKDYSEFLKILDRAFTGAISCLKENRFAIIVCGDIRDEKGFYRRFPDDIKDIFMRAGLTIYNELILIETVGSAAMRVNGAMKSRKVPKTHQNVLVFFKGGRKPTIKNSHKNVMVFYKGDPKQIPTQFKEIEVLDVDFENEPQPEES